MKNHPNWKQKVFIKRSKILKFLKNCVHYYNGNHSSRFEFCNLKNGLTSFISCPKFSHCPVTRRNSMTSAISYHICLQPSKLSVKYRAVHRMLSPFMISLHDISKMGDRLCDVICQDENKTRMCQ